LPEWSLYDQRFVVAEVQIDNGPAQEAKGFRWPQCRNDKMSEWQNVRM